MVAEGRHVAGMDQVWLGLLTEDAAWAPPPPPPQYDKRQRHIEANPQYQTNEQLAAIACLGQSQFKHAFRQQVGMSVSHYQDAAHGAGTHPCCPDTPAHRRGGQPLRLPGTREPSPSAFLVETGLTPLWRQQNGRLP